MAFINAKGHVFNFDNFNASFVGSGGADMPQTGAIGSAPGAQSEPGGAPSNMIYNWFKSLL